MNIGSLADESGLKRMTTPKGLSGKISKQMHSGKSGCLTDEAYVSRTPNIHTGDSYHDYEMHMFTSSYVSATNDICIEVPCSLSSLPLSIIRGSGFKLKGGQEDTKRIPQTFNE